MCLDKGKASSRVRTKGIGFVAPGSGRRGGIFKGLSQLATGLSSESNDACRAVWVSSVCPTCDRATRPIVSLLKTRNTLLFLYFCT